MKLACHLVLQIRDRGYLDVAITKKFLSVKLAKKFKNLSVKLAKNGRKNISSVKVGVHLFLLLFRFPILTELMNYRSHLDGVRFGSWSFREVLDRLLSIASCPVKQALKGEPVGHASELVEKACQVSFQYTMSLLNYFVFIYFF